MTFTVRDALREGFRRVSTPAGLTLTLVYVVLQLASSLVTLNASTSLTPDTPPSQLTPIVLPISPLVGAVLVIVVAVVGIALQVVLVRTMVGEETARVPRDAYQHRLPAASAWAFVTSLVVGLLVAVGLVLLVLPGLFLAASFAFALVYVAVEDEPVLPAMRHSWALASGHRLRLLGLVALPVLIVVVVEGVLGVVAPSTTLLGWVVSSVVSGGFSVYMWGALGDAYRQLRADASDAVGALTADDLA